MVLFTKWIFDKPKSGIAAKAGFRAMKCSVKSPCVFMNKIVFSRFLGKSMYEKG